jgi:outer membrane biosynthesis protein TonB
MSTTKSLSISILEYILSQPAHKLPAVFDLEQCPFPHQEIPLEEVFEEILRLKSVGLIEANVMKGIDGKPYKVQARYVTLNGRNYLEGKNPPTKQRAILGKIVGCLLVAIVVIGFLLIGITRLGFLHGHHEVSPAPTPTPLPTPVSTPTPTPTPEPTPTATPPPTPEPTPTPSPSPKHRAKPHTSPSVI